MTTATSLALGLAFEIVDSCASVEIAVSELRDALRVDHIVYNSSEYGLDPSIRPFVRLTYPATWVKRYLQMGYAHIDPVLKQGFKRSLPFEWAELLPDNTEEASMLIDAIEHGVGPSGLSIPLTSKGGHRALFSMTYSGPVNEWDLLYMSRIGEFVQIANKLHQRVIKENFGEEPPHMTSREVECLRWVAEGKDAGDIAVILNISVFTVRDHLKSARYKLGCVTLAQAVTKALVRGLLPDRGS